MSAPALDRRTFSAPRDSGYAKVETLEKLAGRPKDEFAHVILKEALDNSLDACEDAGVIPEIAVTVIPGDGTVLLAVDDNGPGMDKDAVASICDFTRSTSDKAAYVSPTRGAQGNAWPLIISMPHALGVRPGTVVIEARGIRHEITPDLVLGQRLTISRVPEPCQRTTGTRVIVPLPVSLNLDVTRWVQDYAMVNPHAKFSVHVDGTGHADAPEFYKPAGQDGWRKWLPSQPTSPWWYDDDSLRDLISSYLAAGDDKPLGMFVREFDGLKSTAKARFITGWLRRIDRLSDFKDDPDAVRTLLTTMQAEARKVQPAALGKIPAGHYEAMIARLFGISRDRFWHSRKEVMCGGVPWAVDVAVAATERPGRVIYGTNFGVTFDDPLANAELLDGWNAATGAASFLRQAGAYPSDDNGHLRAAVVHVQCAAPRWTDTGKVKVIVPENVGEEFASAFARATKTLRDERERARKDAAKEQRRQERDEREYWEHRDRAEREPSLKDAVRDVLGQAAGLAEEDPAITMRDLYRHVQAAAAEVTSRELTWRNFRQILDGYEHDHGEIPGLVRDAGPDADVDLSRHPRGPEELKAAARQLGLRSYTELLALSKSNDPYAMGTPEHLTLSRWFAGVHGQVARLRDHIRGIHYKWFTAQAQDADGSRYQNDPEHWHRLSRASKIARALGLVDPETLEDRRNKALRVHTEPRLDSGPEVTLGAVGADAEAAGEWRFPELSLDDVLPSLELPAPEVSGYDYSPADQPEVLVLVTEKMEDVLEPLCRELGVDLLAGTGYESYTRAIQILRHAEARNQPLHVFYVSDYDDAGLNMPVAISRQCQFFAEQLGIKADITLQPLALTAEQVEEYHLPKAPDKKQTELDALEALHPGALAGIFRAAVEARRDATLEERLGEAAEEAQAGAEETWQEVTAELRAELERVEAEAARVIEQHEESERAKAAEIEEATADLRAQIKAIEDEIKATYAPADTAAQAAIEAANTRLEHLAAQVRERWDSAEFDLPARPGPEVDIDDAGLLYDSRRHWLEQLKAFKAAKSGSGDGPGSEPDGDDIAA